MAGFFNLPSSRATTKKDQQLLKKVSSPVKSSTAVTLKGSTKLIDRINAITSLVKSKFAGKEDELELITTEEHLTTYIDKCIENNVISIDTETTGLDPILDNIVGICIYTPGLKAAYIPVNHISYITELKCANQLEIPFLTEQFQRLVDNNVKTIWFNAPFDIRFLGNHINVWFTAYFDTSIAAMCLNSDEPDGSRTLKALHKKYCWGDRGEALTFGKLFDNLPFNLIPIDVAYLYAASDAIYTYELYEFQAQYLEPTGQYYESHNMQGLSNVFFNIEMKSMPTFISMEQTGVAIDYEYAQKIHDKYHELADKMQRNLEIVCEPYQDLINDYRRKHPMCKLTDPVNYNSQAQLSIIFYDILGLKSPDPKNPRGTGADILEQLEHPIAKAVSDNRSFNKVLSAFIDTLPEQAKKYPDKRIHCSFKQYGAACVVGNTSILTDKGSFPIDSLFDGSEESGVSYDTNITVINRDIKPEQASHKIVYKDVDTIKITLRGGYQIEGTPNHPIICSKLTKDDILRNKSTRQISRLPDGADFRMLSDVKVGDIVEIPYGYNIFPSSYVETNFNDIDIPYITEDFAEFLGMYHADGYCKTSNGGFDIVLCNDDEDVISRFSDLCKKLFNVTARTYSSLKHGAVTHCSWYKLRELEKYLSKGARNKSMPIDIMKSPKSVICSYIRGMTLDSGIDESRQRMYMTCVDARTYNFIEQFLLNIGIFTCTRFVKYPRKNNHSGVLCDSMNTYRIGVSGEMYEKFLREIGFIETCKILDVKEYKHSWYLTYNNKYYAYVKKIEHCKSDVYDLTVPNTHSFISNGIVSHNTGRVSCKNPNLQQIPSNPFVLSDGTKIDSGHDVRQFFTASPGCVLMSCDYSGQEVRVTAHLSQDEKLIQAYRDGKDPYCEIASLAYNVPYEECTEYRADGTFNPDGKKRRGESKKIVLGILYGRGIPSIAEQLGKTVQEAQKIYDSVLAKFEGLAHFIEESEDMARKQGFTETLWGRRRQLQDMQLPYYEFGYKNGFAPDFDPLSDDSSDISTEVPVETVKILTNKLLNCWSFKKREELKEKIRQKGYTIKDNSAYIKRAQRQCVNCVDFETEILTTSGWKKYDEVSVGDEIISFNIDSCEVTKDTVKDIHIYDGDFEVYKFKNQSFDAVSTPDHRWVSSTHDTKPKFTTTEKIASTRNNPTYPILKMWDNNFSENTDFTDSQLRVISYLMTDGYFSDIDKPYRAQLVQSESTEKNKRVYSDMIKSLNECGIKFSDKVRFNNCHYLYLYQCDFTEFIRTTFNEHMLTYDFISSLSERQAKIMVDCFVDCDGHTDKRYKSCGRVVFGTKQKADVFQYLCTIAGYATNLYSRDCVGEKHYGNVPNECGYIEAKNIHYIVSILNRKRSHIYKKHIDKLNVHGVWCVSTGNETWIARHNGCVFITGNSRVQGSAADLTKLAQIELFNNKELKDLGFRMLIPVHDEIIAECPVENVKRCSELMSKCMLDAGRNLCVPLSCDVALFKSWYGEELSVDDF